uniref:NADH-ubiquinone oxidoreductase chain 5 n=1 Tax=Ricania speculum TaxID=1902407 RepID=A0A1C9JBY0_9HEMI|nr:NADH dehydrogenase subunit 5 [Ricania speculum]AOP19353.1 NADH dehydrogenase subunit 5 [Ricania speculum]
MFFFFFFSFFFFFFWYLFLWIWSFVFFWVSNFFFNSCSVTLIFLFDWVSLIFMSFVFLISGSVLFYSIGYMNGDKNIVRFFYFVFFFILSMVFFILMPDLVCLLLGWDGLGLVSYCLIIYYQNKISLSSGLITVFMNRVGDVFLILSIGFFFNFGSWHYIFYIDFFDYYFSLIIYLILFASFTSSAQFPFCFWLPAAMAAPTPVSSLVHSSTLVTSGVYLIIRFNYYIYNFDTFFLMFISLVTMFLAGLNACVENDLKKIIAFSTLSQLGFMFFVLSFGSLTLCFMHLLIHAVFKSLLFLCSGFFIHCFFGNQDIRFMGGLLTQCPYISSCFFISSICLCGVPFLSGFYSKDFVFELIVLSETGFFFFFFFCLSISLTIFYSLRLFYYLFFSNSFFFPLMSFHYSFYMNFSLFLLFFFSLFGGSLIFWLFSDFIFIVNFFFSVLILFIFFFCFFFFLGFFNFFFYCGFFFFFFFGSMWFLNYFSSSFFIFRFFNFSSFLYGLVDSGWLEYFVSGGFLGFLNWVSMVFDSFSLNTFYFYMVSFSFFFIFLVVFNF